MGQRDDYFNLYRSLDAEAKESAERNRFGYIYAKADIFLKTGPEIYRKNDFFSMPDIAWQKEDIELITSGCRQILEGKGLTEQDPVTGLGIGAFYKLFALFHFGLKQQHAKPVKKNGKTCFIDSIDFEHWVDKSIVTYFNLVEH